MGKNKYVGHRYVPKIDGEWDKSKSYEPLTVVLYQGASYTSRQNVPTGVEITNGEFWALTANYNAQIEQYRQDVRNLENDVAAQLVETEEELNKQRLNLTSNPNVRPLVTFIDDDGSSSVWTKLKPIFESRGKPYTIALLVDYLKAGGGLTVSQALELQNDLGCEVASHGMQQVQLNDLTESEVVYQLSESKKELKNLGFNVDHYVYGYGYANQTTRDLTRKFYKSGANAQDDGHMGVNTIPIKQYKLNRTGIGVYNGGRTLDDYKARVDKAIAENGWLIFMTHIGETDEQGVQDIKDTLDYIISKGVEVVTLKDGFEVFGNSLFLGDFTGDYHNENYHIIAKNGEEFKNLPKQPNVNVNTPLNNFKIGDTNHTFLNIDNSGFPGGNGNGAGSLLTHRDTHNEYGFSYQLFTHYSGDIYRRKAISSTTWSEWNQIITKSAFDKYSLDISSSKNLYTNDTLPSEFPNWKTTTFYFDSAGKEGFPANAGIVTTYKVDDKYNKGYTRQELRQYASDSVWSRRENTDGTWSAWVKISAV